MSIRYLSGINVDANVLFVDSANDRVGIGTGSPAFPLTVYHATNSAATFQTAGTGTGAGNGFYVGHTGNISYVWNYNNFPIVLATNNSERLRITAAGNVGIGTTNPNTYSGFINLQVNGPDNGLVQVTGSSATIGSFYGGQGQVNFGSTSNHPLSIFTSDVSRVLITAAGNVGIGTTSPAHKLDVAGVGRLLSVGIIQASSNSDTPNIAFTNNGTSFTWGTIGGLLQGDGDGALFFNTKLGGSVTEKMRITSVGNVGIGTTSPGSKLDVYLSEGSYIRATNASSGVGAGNHWGFGLYEGTSLSAAFRIVRDGTGDQVSIGTANNQSFAFWQNNTERMRIAVGGNVGIGTTAPSQKLEVSNGAAQFNGGGIDGTLGEAVLFGQTTYSTVQKNRIRSSISASVNGNLLSLEAGNGTVGAYNNNQLVLRGDGNVGIGTAAPSEKLHVVGTTRSTTFLSANATSSTGLNITSATASGSGAVIRLTKDAADRQVYQSFEADQLYLGVPASNTTLAEVGTKSSVDLRFATAYTERMRITSAGNVGIGTTAPDYKLDVSNAARVYGVRIGRDFSIANRATVRLDSNGDAPADILFGQTAAANQTGWDGVYWSISSRNSGAGAAEGNKFTIWRGDAHSAPNNSESQIVTITPSLNVGIGNTSPSYKLDVAGTAYVSDDLLVGAINAASWHRISVAIGGFIAQDGGRGIGAYVEGTNTAELFAYNYTTPAYVPMNIRTSTLSINNASNSSVIYHDGTNVGINTTAPTARLHVEAPSGDGTPVFRANGTTAPNSFNYAGSLMNADLGSSRNTILLIGKAQSNRDSGYIGFNHSGTNGSNANFLTFGLFQNDNILNITGGGNVGIGTTAPASKLHVRVANGTNDAITIDSPSTNNIVIGGVATGVTYIRSFEGSFEIGNSYSGGDLRLKAGNAEAMRITSAGNVGIGTTAPGAKLQINDGTGSAEFLRLSVAYDTSRSARGGIYWHDTANTTGRIYTEYDGTMTSMVFGSLYNGGYNSNNLMIIRGNGNVGIGTTSPDQLLVVANSTANAESGIIIRNSHADTSAHASLRIDGYAGSFIDFYRNAGLRWRFNRVAFSDDFKISASGSGGVGDVMYFDYDTGNVGIGTTSPGQKLSVNGSVESLADGLGEGGQFILRSAPSGTRRWNIDNYSTSNELRLFTEADSDGSAGAVKVLITEAGNVGIGTTSPAQKLHVAGIVRSDNYYNILGNDVYFGSGSGLLYSGSSSDAVVRSGSNVHLAIGGYTQLIVNSSGNVGIGTTSPTWKLTVLGDNDVFNVTSQTADTSLPTKTLAAFNGIYNSGSNGHNLYISSTGSTGSWEFNTTKTWGGLMSWGVSSNGTSITRHMSLTDSGNVGIGTTSPNEKLHAAGNIHAYAAGGIDAGLFASTSAGSTTIAVRSNGVTHFNGGNVGIGTTSPNPFSWATRTITVVSSASNSYAALEAYGTGTGAGALLLGNTSVLRASIVAEDGSNLLFATNAGNTGSSQSERMRITSGGNVGIGTTAPGAKLDVDGGIWFNGRVEGRTFPYNSTFGSGADATTTTLDAGSTNTYRSSIILAGGSATDPNTIKFLTASAERMRITSAGNVGIGTTSPTNKLTVTTATNAVDVLRLNNTGGDSGSVQGVTHFAINHFNSGTNPSTRITAYQDSTSGWPGGMYFSTRSLNTDSAPVERMRITSTGNVGIGTTSPQYMLDVNGDAQINAEGTGPAYAYVPDGGFGVDNLITSGTENVALGKPDVWLRIHVDGVAFVFPGYQEP